MKTAMRNVAEALCNLASKHKNLVLLHTDFAEERGISSFVDQFPERSFHFGLAEQAMASASAGFAITGKMPFVAGLALFSAGRAYEQIRNTVCEQNLNVKFLGFGDDFKEDEILMKSIPNMEVYIPASQQEAAEIIEKVSMSYGPVYIRVPA